MGRPHCEKGRQNLNQRGAWSQRERAEMEEAGRVPMSGDGGGETRRGGGVLMKGRQDSHL